MRLKNECSIFDGNVLNTENENEKKFKIDFHFLKKKLSTFRNKMIEN